ncbi:chaplin [Streptomyces halobius]|uniref:Chaplin n=1 Tax=Streptomyces halobius TaxID=2879846 RepID=A0ABY4ME65_9ACTN|nr:chaplin [Streptomyces halobius]UQA95039.1 chaplin [Streptomyces halobius]
MITKVIAASAAAGGLLLASAGTTVADTGAKGKAAGSPGVLSGNLLQVPIHIPANFCGNTVNVPGLLNPTLDNTCINVDSHSHGKGGDDDKGGAKGAAKGSAGILSGNLGQLPVHVPVNACGNSGNVIGALNVAFGNDCANVKRPHHDDSADPKTEVRDHKPSPHHHTADTPDHRPSAPPETKRAIEHHDTPELAKTGAEKIGLAIPASAGLMLGGFLLYRRGRRASARN